LVVINELQEKLCNGLLLSNFLKEDKKIFYILWFFGGRKVNFEGLAQMVKKGPVEK